MTGLLLAPQAQRLARALADRFGLALLPGSQHILVANQSATHLVVVYPEIFTWQLATAPRGEQDRFDQAWTYTGSKAFMLAYTQAMLWPAHDAGTHVPLYWYRDMTGQRRTEFLFRD